MCMTLSIRINSDSALLTDRKALAAVRFLMNRVVEITDIAAPTDALFGVEVARLDSRRHGIFFAHASGPEQAPAAGHDRILVERMLEIAGRLEAAASCKELQQGWRPRQVPCGGYGQLPCNMVPRSAPQTQTQTVIVPAAPAPRPGMYGGNQPGGMYGGSAARPSVTCQTVGSMTTCR